MKKMLEIAVVATTLTWILFSRCIASGLWHTAPYHRRRREHS